MMSKAFTWFSQSTKARKKQNLDQETEPSQHLEVPRCHILFPPPKVTTGQICHSRDLIPNLIVKICAGFPWWSSG